MKYVFASRSLVALALAKHARAFAPSSFSSVSQTVSIGYAFPAYSTIGTKRFMSSGEPLQVTQIDKQGLNEIIEDIEMTSREESGYVVIDVVS